MWLISGLAVVAVLGLSLRGLSNFYTDYLWFDSVGQDETWKQLLGAKIAPALVFTLVFFVFLFVNLVIADRLSARLSAVGPEDEMIERYQQAVAPYTGRIRVGVAAVFALFAGAGLSSHWEKWVLFRNSVDFGVKDPEFKRDIGFYIFELPFLKFIVDWAFISLVMVLLVTAVAHYLNGGIRFQMPYQRVTPQVKGHLSVILALMAMVKAADYLLSRYDLALSDRGPVKGASYTDLKAQLPAIQLLTFIAVVAALLFVWNIWRRGWVLPVIAVGLWGFISIVLGTIYPAAIQKFQVEPNEFAKEQKYIQRNIAATRAAFGLDKVTETTFDYTRDLSGDQINENRGTIDNARLWDPDVISPSFVTQEGYQTFYRVGDVDVDRYKVAGQTRQVLISARELNSADLPSQSWTNRHLNYTHGYGVIASPTNEAPGGNPEYFANRIPQQGSIKPSAQGAQIYFGEDQGGHILVGAKQAEFNFPREGLDDARSRYAGDDGVKLSSPLRRMAFALRFGQFNLMISDQITSNTKIVFQRDIMDRVRELAPFLKFDRDPYPVVSDGRVTWVIDGFTSTDHYPYSQTTSGEGGLAGSFNYVRNSVKVTVDAYDGTVRFYVIDPKDPLVRSYRKAFKGLFTDFDKMPRALREHLRYPEDLFKVQTSMYSRYHVTEPRRFYQKSASWLVSPEPGGSAGLPTQPTGGGTGTTAVPQDASSDSKRMDPYYLYIRLPGEKRESFLMLRPFVPISRDNKQTRLASFMVAKSDPDEYGKLQSFVMPTDSSVLGPAQADNDINSDAVLAPKLTLLDQRGSKVVAGSLQLMPVDKSIVYLRPYYVEREASGGYPRFEFVVVYVPGRAPVAAETVEEGLDEIFGVETPTADDPAKPDDPTTPETPSKPATDLASILSEIAKVQADQRTAQENFDLGGYKAATDALNGLIVRLRAALDAAGIDIDQSADLSPNAAGESPAGRSPTSSTTARSAATPTSPVISGKVEKALARR